MLARALPHPLLRSSAFFAAIPLIIALATAPVAAQQTGAGSRANWGLLERFSPDNLNRFIHSTTVAANWIHETDSLWYRFEDRDGVRFQLVVPAGPRKQLLFDHARMAELLSAQLGTYLEAHDLPLEEIEFADDGRSFEFEAKEVRFRYELVTGALTNLGPVPEEEREEREWRNFSPDSTAYVYAENHNLYVVERADGQDQPPVQISTDGVADFSFGARETNNNDDQDQQQQREDEATARRVRPTVNWSEDSRAFSITRQDRRHVEKLYLVNSLAEPRPTLEEYRYAMPGEDSVPQLDLFVYSRDTKALRELNVDRWPDQRLLDIHWTNGTGEKLRMVRRARTQRALELIEVDVQSLQIRPLVSEAVDEGHLRTTNVRYLGEDNSGDFIWYSRRTGWAHLYRYSHDGELRNQVTSGSWNVMAISEVDDAGRTIWFTAVGREAGENPYYQHLYRVGPDGLGLSLLDEGNADHRSSLSPSQRYVLDNGSRVDLTPRSLLRDARGRVVMELEAMDVSELVEFGWRPPETFVVKAADGVTDIYGNMWKPFDFDPAKSYPIIAHVYPGPQTEQVTTTFSANPVQQQLAQLGFVVIQIGNRGGSPLRSAAYHSYGYFNLRDYGLDDKRAGIQELAKRHPWIDVERVGIYGHSGGGFMTAAALLVPPYNDFFKVGVSSSGNHDNNVYNQNWSEQHHGLEVKCVPPEARAVAESAGEQGQAQNGAAPAREGAAAPAGEGGSGAPRREIRTVPNESQCQADEAFEYEIEVPANHELAANLKGQLLLVHGDMDNNVHYAGTLRLVRELIRADKRFDFLMFPGARHGFGEYQPYFNNMLREYFAEHLLGDYYGRNADVKVRP
jgi:dipeptidyl aminopeptidase/acylaminoacyl peptidase